MNRIIIALCLILSLTASVFAQNYTKHTVTKGETVTQIAAKYKVTPYDIYRLNPDAQGGIKEQDVVLIPISTVATPAPVATTPKPASALNKFKTHTAAPKETLYSIARQYNVTIDDLKLLNPDVFAGGLKIGQEVKIPNSAGTSAVSSVSQAAPKIAVKPVSASSTVYHIVAPKETKFGIAKHYEITVEELEHANPGIISNLPIGYKLAIPAASQTTVQTVTDVKPKPVVTELEMPATTIQSTTTNAARFSGFANYEVKPKETMFSLAHLFDITQEELLLLNPTLKDGVKVGMILKVPGQGSMTLQTAAGASVGYKDLTQSLNTVQKKQLVMLMPFNAERIQGDTLKTIQLRLKKDAFLNMTLDFYSGALMAIDSAKTLGLNVDVSIYDSEESKSGSNVAEVIAKNKLSKADAVIGPFYQQYAEIAAGILAKDSVAVISPLSKENGKNYPNLYQSMPPLEFTKSAMLNFLKSKNGNILVVSDPKRQLNKDFINANYPGAKWVTVSDNGSVDIGNLKSLLVSDRVNYVVMDSEKTGMILSTTTALLNEMENFQIQLVIIEPNDTLDYEEVSMKRLTLLKLLYPSMTRENLSAEAQQFENAYKERNKIFPSQFATRGFDITFDTLLRLSQGKRFSETVADKTQQVESQFHYLNNIDTGYSNKGIYIFEYQEDLSIKQVN